MSFKNKLLYFSLFSSIIGSLLCSGPEPVSLDLSGMPDGIFLEVMQGQELEVVESLSDSYCSMPGADNCNPEFSGDLTYSQSTGGTAHFTGVVKNNYSGNPVAADVDITLNNWAGIQYQSTFNGFINWKRVAENVEYNGNLSTPAQTDIYAGETTASSGAFYKYSFNYRKTTITGTIPSVFWYEGTVTFNNIRYTFTKDNN